MNIKNTIIEHYRKFFDLHAKGIALDEDDHLNIDWAEDLVKNCFIPNVIHWVAVKDAQPARRDLAYLTYDESGFMTWRYWKDTFWEGEHIVNEPKVTHWTIVQPPCV